MSTLVSFTKSANDEATEGAVYAMPATPLQVRLWKLNEAAPDPAWNVAVRFRLSGSLDREKFEQALQWLVIRHEALRTSFTVRDGEVSERILAKASLPLQWCDLETLDPAAQEAEVARLSLEHARQILPLTSAPLLRAGMLRLADTEHILVWNAHHSVCDGWSVGLLVSDLMACYGDVLQGKEPVAPTALDFGDYAVWLDAQRKTPEYESHRVYWKQQLQDLEVAPLPDAWHAAATAKESTIQSMLLPRSLTDAIATVAQRHHSTFFHAVLAAFGLLLRTQQLQADVALETPIGGRDQSELENVVGAFVNYLPLRFRVDEEMRFSDLLHAVRDMVTDCFDHAQFRCEDMLADLEKEGNPAAKGKTLTQVAFICQQDFVRPITTGGVAMTAVPSVSPGALRPLTVFMVERADGWRLSCEVDNHLVSQDAGLRLLEDFQRLLGVVVGAAEEWTVEVAARAGLAPIATQADQNIATRFQGALQLQDGVVRMPATEFQRRFCRLDSLNPGGIAFHVRVRLQLTGRLDVEALARAIACVGRRNEILRTTLREEGDEVWQVVHPELPIDFRMLVSEVQGPDAVRSEAQRLADRAIIDQEGGEGFSLANGPLYRVRVLRLESDRHWLAITMSHAIVDGWATGIFLEQLQQAYEEEVGSRAAGKTSVLQFSVYADSERKLLKSPEKDRRLAWWQSYVGGVWAPLELPNDLDTSRPDAGDAPAGLVVERLDPETAANAKRFAREHGKAYETLRLVVAHLGSGISVSAHESGRMVDVTNSREEGAFSTERAGGVPIMQLVDLCFSGRYTKKQVEQLLFREGGLYSYLGTKDVIEVEERIASGDAQATTVFDAMAYQIAKEIGAMAAALHGRVYAVLLTGGMAHSSRLVAAIQSYVSWIAPVVPYPGEDELQALAEGALRVLRHDEEVRVLAPAPAILTI